MFYCIITILSISLSIGLLQQCNEVVVTTLFLKLHVSVSVGCHIKLKVKVASNFEHSLHVDPWLASNYNIVLYHNSYMQLRYYNYSTRAKKGASCVQKAN